MVSQAFSTLGTGNAESFEEVAKAVIKYHGKGSIETIPFPEHLKGALPRIYSSRPH